VLQFAKTLTLGKVWNFWITAWTGDASLADTTLFVDTAELNFCFLLAFVFEAVPHLLIQTTNNQLLGKWTTLEIFSVSMSAITVLNGIYKLYFHTSCHRHYVKTVSSTGLLSFSLSL
jgi:hypothetical protein